MRAGQTNHLDVRVPIVIFYRRIQKLILLRTAGHVVLIIYKQHARKTRVFVQIIQRRVLIYALGLGGELLFETYYVVMRCGLRAVDYPCANAVTFNALVFKILFVEAQHKRHPCARRLPHDYYSSAAAVV